MIVFIEFGIILYPTTSPRGVIEKAYSLHCIHMFVGGNCVCTISRKVKRIAIHA